MLDWLSSLWDTTGFVPRRNCGAWTDEWVAVHALSDVLIWLAYLSIPLVLLAAVRHPAARPYRLQALLFAAFILACGTVHLIEAVIFEHPLYRLSGAVKAATALVSWATVFVLIPTVPRILERLNAVPAGPPPADGEDEVTGAYQPAPLLYMLAILVGLLAVLLRYALDPLLRDLHPYTLCVLAVTFVSWYGGFLPGLVTLLVSGATTTYLFVSPRHSLLMSELNQQVGLGLFLMGGVGVTVVGESQRSARRRLHRKILELNATAAALDVETRKAAEALAALDALIGHSPYGIAQLDGGLRFRRVNGAFGLGDGRAPARFEGRALDEACPSVPADLLAEFERVRHTGEAISARLVVTPTAIREVSAFAVPQPDGTSGLGLIDVDVTERKVSEERLRESEGRFRQLAETMPQIVWKARPDGYHYYFNRRWYEYTGQTPEESIGRGWDAAVHPDDRRAARPRWEAALAAGTVYEAEVRLRRADGQYHAHLARAFPVRNEGGEVVRWLGTYTDIEEQVRTKRQLADATRFAETVLDSLSSQIAVLGADGTILAVNRSWRRFGAESGVAEDYPWEGTDYVTACRDAADGERAAAGIRAVASGERPAFEMEYPCPAPDGERYFHLRVRRFADDDPVRLVVSHEDITARVVAERRIRAAESQLRQLTEAVPLLMWSCVPTGECDYLSRQWVEYTGVPAADQMPFGWLDALHPDDREPTAAAWREATQRTGEYDVEFRLRRHDGAHRWFAVRGIPLRDRGGDIVRWYGSCTDIDDRKRRADTLEREVAERTTELRQQQIFVSAILDNIAEGVVACGADGQLKLFNAATREMHGLPAEPLPPAEWAAHYQLYEADGVTAMTADRVPLHRALRGETVRDAELVIRRPGHPDRYVLCTGQPLRAAGGPQPDGTRAGAVQFGAVVSMRDMTARRDFERQLLLTAAALRTSNEELDKFAYVASHDLQEPLRKIQAFGSRLAEKFRAALDEPGRDYLDRMLASAGRMRRLITDLLAFSRVNTQASEFGRVDLDGVLDDVRADLEERLAETGGRVDVASPLPAVRGDASLLRQVFQNLIANALKFARDGVPPAVRVAADTGPAGGPRVTVSDNGIGFAPEFGERVFELFQRLHAKTRYEGSGLGLAIVRKILLRHGATITAHGRPGEGAAFVIDWPSPDAADAAPGGDPAARSGSSP